MVGCEALPVDVWLIRWAAPSPVGDDLLSASERSRADRFRRPGDRAAYVAAHAALRRLVGARVGVAPHAVRFGHDPCPLCGAPHGRPTVIGGGPQISLSRTDGVAAVALSPAVVGVDVESLGRAVELDDLVAAMHPRELPVTDRRQALRHWVRKEAYLKGLGTGLGLDPATVDVSADPPGWQLLDVPAGRYVLSAVAVRSAAPVTLTVATMDADDP